LSPQWRPGDVLVSPRLLTGFDDVDDAVGLKANEVVAGLGEVVP